jgi:hypothetical protein
MRWLGVCEKINASKKPPQCELQISSYMMTTVLWDMSPCSLVEMYLLLGITAKNTVVLFFKLTAFRTSETSDFLEHLRLTIAATVWRSNVKDTILKPGYQLIQILLTLMICHAPNRNEYQDYFLVGKRSRCVWLTTLPPSSADCLEIWEPQPPATLRACPGL